MNFVLTRYVTKVGSIRSYSYRFSCANIHLHFALCKLYRICLQWAQLSTFLAYYVMISLRKTSLGIAIETNIADGDEATDENDLCVNEAAQQTVCLVLIRLNSCSLHVLV